MLYNMTEKYEKYKKYLPIFGLPDSDQYRIIYHIDNMGSKDTHEPYKILTDYITMMMSEKTITATDETFPSTTTPVNITSVNDEAKMISYLHNKGELFDHRTSPNKVLKIINDLKKDDEDDKHIFSYLFKYAEMKVTTLTLVSDIKDAKTITNVVFKAGTIKSKTELDAMYKVFANNAEVEKKVTAYQTVLKNKGFDDANIIDNTTRVLQLYYYQTDSLSIPDLNMKKLIPVLLNNMYNSKDVKKKHEVSEFLKLAIDSVKHVGSKKYSRNDKDILVDSAGKVYTLDNMYENRKCKGYVMEDDTKDCGMLIVDCVKGIGDKKCREALLNMKYEDMYKEIDEMHPLLMDFTLYTLEFAKKTDKETGIVKYVNWETWLASIDSEISKTVATNTHFKRYICSLIERINMEPAILNTTKMEDKFKASKSSKPKVVDEFAIQPLKMKMRVSQPFSLSEKYLDDSKLSEPEISVLIEQFKRLLEDYKNDDLGVFKLRMFPRFTGMGRTMFGGYDFNHDKKVLQNKLNNVKGQTWYTFNELFNRIKAELLKKRYELIEDDASSIQTLIDGLKTYETKLLDIFLKLVSYVPDKNKTDETESIPFTKMLEQYETNKSKITNRHNAIMKLMETLSDTLSKKNDLN
jgi:hypothetical protein